MNISLISLNTRGLRNQEKHQGIFNYYKKRANILCFQETHSDESVAQIWENEF